MSLLGPLCIILAAVLWSLDGVLRQSLYAAPSLLVVTLEHALGTLLFLPLLVARRDAWRGLSFSTWGSLAWVSLFGGILGTFFYTKALSYVGYIDLSVVVLLQKLQPFFAILLAVLLLRERITRRFVGLALLACAGGYLVTFADLLPRFATDGNDGVAALLAIGAAFCWGTSTAVGKKALAHANFFVITGLRLAITAVIGMSAAAAFGQLPAIASLDEMQWRSLLLIVFSTGAVALAIYYFGLKRVPASHATLYELAWPLSAMVIDYAVHRTFLAPTQYLGAGLLLLAMFLLTREKRST